MDDPTMFNDLSKRAKLLFRWLYGPWVLYAIYSASSFTGPVRWLSVYEASINQGKFHPYTSFSICLALPGGAIMMLVRAYDRVTKRGFYGKKKPLSSEDGSVV